MNILGKIFGDTAKGALEGVGGILDNVFTSKEEKLSHKEVMARIAQKPKLVNQEINKIEAQHRSIFVAGWRPFIGWVCGSALAYNYIFRDLLTWIITITEATSTMPPALQMNHLMTILTGMLGLAGYRTVEKLKGRAK